MPSAAVAGLWLIASIGFEAYDRWQAGEMSDEEFVEMASQLNGKLRRLGRATGQRDA